MNSTGVVAARSNTTAVGAVGLVSTVGGLPATIDPATYFFADANPLRNSTTSPSFIT